MHSESTGNDGNAKLLLIKLLKLMSLTKRKMLLLKRHWLGSNCQLGDRSPNRCRWHCWTFLGIWAPNKRYKNQWNHLQFRLYWCRNTLLLGPHYTWFLKGCFVKIFSDIFFKNLWIVFSSFASFQTCNNSLFFVSSTLESFMRVFDQVQTIDPSIFKPTVIFSVLGLHGVVKFDLSFII